MIKRKIDSYLRSFFTKSRKALLLDGARQTGKTYAIRHAGRTLFEHFVEINFVEQPEIRELVNTMGDTRQLLLRLSALMGSEMVPGKTLIFFDEVQACPEIVTKIKFLVDEGSYRYAMSGSLLGVELNDLRSAPVGYVEEKVLYPLDIEEFMEAIGTTEDVMEHVRECWTKKEAVDQFVHQQMMNAVRLYLVIGGMPAVVAKYLETSNLQVVLNEQRSILALYERDIAKYDAHNKLYIREIFRLIPPELNAQNKRFILKQLNENLKFDRYENSFLWLKDAGVALPVYNVDEPTPPLLLSRSRNLFKLFQNDVGLLAAQYAEGLQLRLIMGDDKINCGAIYENLVAQELHAHGFELYYFNSKKMGELDFVVERDGRAMPIEVKSGKDYQRHRAMNNVLQTHNYNTTQPIVLCNDNLSHDGSITYAPIYMLMFLQRDLSAPTYYKIEPPRLGEEK
ncbi:MAG: ATP-binding protein [Bacteroidaceae bacterium]|nr:ATP-binding protein [Bacteroidaceae bacterium]